MILWYKIPYHKFESIKSLFFYLEDYDTNSGKDKKKLSPSWILPFIK